jgi:hypothetical protein
VRAYPGLFAAALAPCRRRAGTKPAIQAPMSAAAIAAVFAHPQRPSSLPGPCCEAVRRGRRASRIETVGEGVVGSMCLGVRPQSHEVQRRPGGDVWRSRAFPIRRGANGMGLPPSTALASSLSLKPLAAPLFYRLQFPLPSLSVCVAATAA